MIKYMNLMLICVLLLLPLNTRAKALWGMFRMKQVVADMLTRRRDADGKEDHLN